MGLSNCIEEKKIIIVTIIFDKEQNFYKVEKNNFCYNSFW